MKVLHISDNPNKVTATNCICNDPESLIKLINEKYFDTDIFIINLNYKFEGLLRSQNQGILLLKLFRLHRFQQHCIVYSFLSREQLMLQDPKNLILYSEGITFIHLPKDLNQLDFASLINSKSPTDLTEFFKAETKLPDDRHFFANWWGVLRLWDVQKAVEKIAGKTVSIEVEKSFDKSLKEMNSYQGLLVRYIKGLNEKDIELQLKELSRLKKEKFESESRKLTEIQNETNNIIEERATIQIQIDILDDIYETDKNSIFEKIRLLFTKLPNTTQKKLIELHSVKNAIDDKINNNEEYLELINHIEIEKSRVYEEFRKKNRQLLSKVSILEDKKNFLNSNFSVENLRERLSKQKPKILYVDDQANDGWAYIFQRMIYGGINESFQIIEPASTDSIDSIAENIKEKIFVTKIDLLILDLRLKAEKGSVIDTSKISGIQVLKRLKELKVACPILITTASNKIWSYKETFSSGASAFWIKEGLDENYNTEASIENYLRFLDLVYLLSNNPEIGFIYQNFLKKIVRFENTELINWWETKFWEGKKLVYIKNTVTKRDEIINCLYNAFSLYEDALRLKIQNIETVQLSTNIYSLILLQLSEILELIHKADSNSTINLSDRVVDQLGQSFFKEWSIKLYNKRNEAAHLFNINFNGLVAFIDNLFEYLYTTPNDSIFDESDMHKDERQEPIDGQIYQSKIISINIARNLCFVENPGLILLDNKDKILLSMLPNRNPEFVGINSATDLIGKQIIFTLNISDTQNESNPEERKINYYAKNAKMIEH